jgi:hypothetical protein
MRNEEENNGCIFDASSTSKFTMQVASEFATANTSNSLLELEHWILILGLIVFGWTLLDIRSMAGTPGLTLISSLVAVIATLAVVVAKDLKLWQWQQQQ